MTNCIVTGATGFIAEYLMSEYEGLKGVVREGRDHNFTDVYRVESIDGNTSWTGAFQGINTVIHLAGLAHSHQYTLEDYQSINVDGTLRLANEAVKAGVKRFVFVSSIGVNGISTSNKAFNIKSIVDPHNAYALSKYNAELGLKKIADDTGLEVVIVRPTLVYGPNAPGNFGKLVKLVEKLPVLPFGLVSNRRDFIAVQNLADLLMCCATHPKAPGNVFLASDGQAVSTKEFTNSISTGLGKVVIQVPVPIGVIRFVSRFLGKSLLFEQLFGNLEVDSSNINHVLGWTPPLNMNQAMETLRGTRK